MTAWTDAHNHLQDPRLGDPGARHRRHAGRPRRTLRGQCHSRSRLARRRKTRARSPGFRSPRLRHPPVARADGGRGLGKATQIHPRKTPRRQHRRMRVGPMGFIPAHRGASPGLPDSGPPRPLAGSPAHHPLPQSLGTAVRRIRSTSAAIAIPHAFIRRLHRDRPPPDPAGRVFLMLRPFSIRQEKTGAQCLPETSDSTGSC